MIEYLIPASVIGFCAYMSHLGKKRADAINERMKRFHREAQEILPLYKNSLDEYHVVLQELGRKHKLVLMQANFPPESNLENKIFLN